MSDSSKKRKTRRSRDSSPDDSPKYTKYTAKSFPPLSAKSHIKPIADLEFSVFVPPEVFIMRVKSKSYPKTSVPYQLLNRLRSSIKPNISYEDALEHIKEHVESNKCKYLRKSVAIESAEESNIGCIIKTRKGQMVGFFTIYFTVKDRGADSSIYSAFVDILCGHPDYSGIGSEALNYIKTHICEPLGIRKIELESITESLGFYLKKGFQCNPCKLKLDV